MLLNRCLLLRVAFITETCSRGWMLIYEFQCQTYASYIIFYKRTRGPAGRASLSCMCRAELNKQEWLRRRQRCKPVFFQENLQNYHQSTKKNLDERTERVISSYLGMVKKTFSFVCVWFFYCDSEQTLGSILTKSCTQVL